MHIPRSIWVVCLLMLALVAGCTPNAANTPEAAVKSALRLVQANDYESLISQFMQPDMLARRIKSQGSLEKVAKSVELSISRDMVLGLMEATNSAPQYSEDGIRAVFELSNPALDEYHLTFIKIGDRWYIED